MHLNVSTRLHVHVHLSSVAGDSKGLLPECSACVNKALIKHNSNWQSNFSLEVILTMNQDKLCSRLLRRHARWMRLLQVRDMNKLYSRASVHHLGCVKLSPCTCSHSSCVVILNYLSELSVGIPSSLVSQQLLCHVHRKAFVYLLLIMRLEVLSQN